MLKFCLKCLIGFYLLIRSNIWFFSTSLTSPLQKGGTNKREYWNGETVIKYFTLKIENDELEIDSLQVPGAFNAYGSYIGDSILKMLQPVAESVIGEELYPCYTFFRLYNHMDWLKPHTDRPSCEFSATIPIFTDKPWPIYMQEYDLKKYGTESTSWQDSAENEKSINVGCFVHFGSIFA